MGSRKGRVSSREIEYRGEHLGQATPDQGPASHLFPNQPKFTLPHT